MDNKNSWIWTLVQGIAAIGLGLWALIGRESALVALTYAGAIYVAIAGLISTLRALLNWGAADATSTLVRGLIGLIGGAVVLAMAFFTNSPTATTLIILAIVLIAYGAVGLFSSLFARGGRPFEWQPVLVNALLVLLGVLFFIDRAQEIDILLWTAIIFIVTGIITTLYAVTRQRNHADVTASV